MDRRQFILSVGSALIGLGTALKAKAFEGFHSAKMPNVVIFLADDLRFDCIGAFGNPHIKTPNLDRLAANGIRFTQCYIMGSTMPAVCQPSRIMLMTGCTLFRQETRRNFLPKTFKGYGYRTFHTGKRGNECIEARKWFDVSIISQETGHWKLSELEKHESVRFRDQAAFCVDKFIEFLKTRNEEEPFFAYIAPSNPHDPLDPAPKHEVLYKAEEMPLPPNVAEQHKDFFLGDTNVRSYTVGNQEYKTPVSLEILKEIIAKYYATVTMLDEQVGRTIEALEKEGCLDNTIFVFTSDNGLALGDHGLIHKQNLYEHMIRVPMIISGPRIPKGAIADAMVYLSDLYPTLCDAVGLPIPQTVETRSFINVLRNPNSPHREDMFYAYREQIRAVRKGHWKLIEYALPKPPEGHQIPDMLPDELPSGWTIERRSQLFDLKSDPFETRNLADDPRHSKQLLRMRELLRKKQAELGSKPFPI